MNKELIIKLRNQAIDNVCNKRKLSDGQIERTWLQDDFDIEFARFIVAHATGCVRDVLRDENSDLGYDAATQVQERIKEHFGILNERTN